MGFLPGAVNDPLEYAEQFGQVREQVPLFVNDDLFFLVPEKAPLDARCATAV
jgi:hypothetical protein